jgi:hypothetical protein
MNIRTSFMNFGQRMNVLWILEVWTRFKLFLNLKKDWKIKSDAWAEIGLAAQLAWLRGLAWPWPKTVRMAQTKQPWAWRIVGLAQERGGQGMAGLVR